MTARPRGRRHLLGAAGLLALLIVVAGAIVWWATRGPLAGETYHDFGLVSIEGRTTTVEHVFELTNRSGTPVRIVEVIPSCGCTTVGVSREALAPGEATELSVALTVAHGTRKKSITLIVDDGERERTQLLWVEATGQATETMRVTRRTVPLRVGTWSTVTLREQTLEATEPPTPRIEAPSGVETSFSGWTRSGRGTNPYAWTGTLRLRGKDGTEPMLPAPLIVGLDEQSLELTLVAPEPRSAPQAGPDEPERQEPGAASRP